MAAIGRLAVQFGKSLVFQPSRNISLTSTAWIKQINTKKEGNTLTIDATIVPDNDPRIIKGAGNNACRLCSTGVDVKHTDVLILSQFLRKDGCMLPRRITGLCKIQQKRVGTMVAMAQKAGLMPNLAPKNSKKNPKRRRDWRKFNTYFDEKTIRARYYLQ